MPAGGLEGPLLELELEELLAPSPEPKQWTRSSIVTNGDSESAGVFEGEVFGRCQVEVSGSAIPVPVSVSDDIRADENRERPDSSPLAATVTYPARADPACK